MKHNRELMRQYRELFNTPAGKAVLYDLFKLGFMWGTTATTADPYELAINEGRRQMALYILQKIGMNEELMLRMYEETLDKQAEEFDDWRT